MAGCRSWEGFTQSDGCHANGFGTPTYQCPLKEELFLLKALLNFVTECKQQPFLCFFTLGKKSRMQNHNHQATLYQGKLFQVGQL